MKRGNRIIIWVLALVMLLPAVAMRPAKAEASMALGASVTTQGVAVSEQYTLRMTAGDASCPMPGGKQGGTYDLLLSQPGLATFPLMTFTAPGNYLYTIRQIPGAHELALSYDDSVYDLRVQVRDDGGKLQLTAIMNRQGSDKKAASADFLNKYVEPATSHNPPVKKVVTGDKPATDAAFTFSMRAVSNTAKLAEMPMPEGATRGVKTMRVPAGTEKEFGEMTFSVPGTYVYEITEANDGQAGYTYDGSVYRLTYVVARKGDKLTCERTVTKDGREVSESTFTYANAYKAPVSPTATPSLTPKPTSTPTPSPTPSPTPTKGSGGGGGGGSGGGGATTVPKIEVTGQKRWVDDGNLHRVRPKSITVTLYADDVPVEGATPTWTSTEGDTWTYTFGRLPEVNSSGSTITYTVKEEPVPYYQATVTGTTIVNQIEEREPTGYTTVSGTKTWDDGGDPEGKRPGSITVQLLRNGVVVDREIVTMATGWRYTFDNLPTDDGYGHNYTYAVREEGVKGYFPTYDGYDIVNKPIGKVDGRFGSSGSGQGGGATGEPGTTDELIEELKRHWTGTPLPWFWRLTDAQLEALLLLFDYRVPSWGKLFGTGDELPLYPFIFGGAGVLAVALLVALGRGKKKRRRRR